MMMALVQKEERCSGKVRAGISFSKRDTIGCGGLQQGTLEVEVFMPQRASLKETLCRPLLFRDPGVNDKGACEFRRLGLELFGDEGIRLVLQLSGGEGMCLGLGFLI